MSWSDWAAGVLNGIGAPVDATNIDTLYAWSNAETAPYDLMRWNNPLNTTEKYGSSFDSGAQPGQHDVQVYASVQDGINATVLTLTNGYYPTIVSHLRNSIPRQQWADCCTELGRWGTGCGWIDNTYGPAPEVGVIDLTTEEHDALMAIAKAIYADNGNNIDAIAKAVPADLIARLDTMQSELAALKTQVATLQQPTITVPTQITLQGELHS